jgi:hypothetical protein
MSSKYDPDHYQLGRIQVWDFIVDQDMDFLSGNIIKYLCRAGNKPHESKLDDLLKAKVYLNKLIHTVSNVESPRLDGPSPEVPSSDGATMCIEGCQCPCHAEEADI